MGKLWERLKKNPALLALGIALVAVIIYVIAKSTQNQTGNPQGGASSGSAGIDPQSGLPIGQSSSQGGYYLLSEEDVPGAVNVTIGATTQPTPGRRGIPGPPGPRGRPGPPGPRGVHEDGPHIRRDDFGRSHRRVGTNPNVHHREPIDVTHGFHTTHIVSPIPWGIHPPNQHNTRPIAAASHITFKGNLAGYGGHTPAPTPFNPAIHPIGVVNHPMGAHSGPAFHPMGVRSGVRPPGIRTH